MGENEAAENAEQMAENASTTLTTAQGQFLQNPLFQGLQNRAQQLLGQPFTYQPSDVARLQQQSAGTMHDAAKGFLDQGMGKLAGTGSGTRGGAANNLMAETASRFAPALAQQNANIERAALEQRNADLVNAFNLAGNVLGQQYAFPRDIAQAQLGGGQILGSLAGQPSPLAQGLGGAGALGGTILGAPTAAGGSLAGSIFGK